MARRASSRLSILRAKGTADLPCPLILQVKITLEKDPRYDAVGSSSQREELFEKFLARNGSSGAEPSMAGAPSEPAEDPAVRKAREKKERAAASLREREEQIRAQQRKVGQDVQRSRGLVGREEAEREFGTLLVDKVHEHDVSRLCSPLLPWPS